MIEALRRPASEAKKVVGVSIGTAAWLLAGWSLAFAAPYQTPPTAPVPPPAETRTSSDPAAVPAPPSPPASSPSADTTEKPPKAPDVFTPPPAVNPRLTWANYEQVREGMTEEQVKAILGDPTQAKSKLKKDAQGGEPRQVRILEWAQLKPFVDIEVEFPDGRAGVKNTTLLPHAIPGKPGRSATASAVPTPPKPPAPAPATLGPLAKAAMEKLNKPPASAPAKEASRLSRALFNLIQNGMTEQQVTAILGPPKGSSTNQGTINGRPFHSKKLLWKQDDPNMTITVTLTDHKVSGKNCIQIGPKKKS